MIDRRSFITRALGLLATLPFVGKLAQAEPAMLSLRSREDIEQEIAYLYAHQDSIREQPNRFMDERYSGHISGRICALEAVLGRNDFFYEPEHDDSVYLKRFE